jgi:hypothetical protein
MGDEFLKVSQVLKCQSLRIIIALILLAIVDANSRG